MKSELLIFDLDHTLIDRSTPSQLKHINFSNLYKLKQKAESHNIDLSMAILSSSCAESVQEIISFNELDVFDFLLFENGGIEVIQNQIKRNYQKKGSFLDKEELIKKLSSLNFDDNIFHKLSNKNFTIALHSSNPIIKERISEKLKKILSEISWEMTFSSGKTVELSPKGLNKLYGFHELLRKKKWDRKYFVCDQPFPGGNDHILSSCDGLDKTIEVNNPCDTDKWLKSVIENKTFNL